MENIRECDFCSVDCELSGITQFAHLNSFDTPKNRYDKMRKVIKNKSFKLKLFFLFLLIF